MTIARAVVGVIGMGESARWHDGRLWFADWTALTINVLEPGGDVRMVTSVPSFPVSFDWLPDGRMLVVSGAEGSLLVWEDGVLGPYLDLSAISATPWNEIVTDTAGRAWVNGIGYAYPGPPQVAGSILRLDADGTTEVVAQDLDFPNGMVLTRDGHTLVVAESHAGRLTAFDISPAGALTNQRTWAAVEGSAPDGICLGSGGIWYSDVPNRCCTLVAEGGAVLDTVRFDDGSFSCVVGDGTLYALTADWPGALNPGAEPSGRVMAARLFEST
ncbi:MAG TPA: SMP-30/gluconolactonase/LRE family protein [Galbitalea sp.]|jgi:sugar lactone lactonase YvrE|nr:SMP-30/gluconolactonase/LRE family protein [Galbitalea sp.]